MENLHFFSISVPVKIKYSAHLKIPFFEKTTIFKLDEVWFNSLSSFITKLSEMNLDFKIAEGDELKILWIDPLGNVVLIENDETLQMALETSRSSEKYLNNSDWNNKLRYALTGLYTSYSPFFTLTIINEGQGPWIYFSGEAQVNKKDDGDFTLQFESPNFYKP